MSQFTWDECMARMKKEGYSQEQAEKICGSICSKKEAVAVGPDEEHTGVMVAFFLPPDVAQELAVPGGEKPEALHITLAYLGDVDGISDPDRLKAVLRAWAARRPFIEGTISGTGRFDAGEDGMEAFYASFDAPALPAWRQELVGELEAHAFPVRKDHGFTPHITLAYLEKGQPAPVDGVKSQKVRFDRLALALGEDVVQFDLVALERQTEYHEVAIAPAAPDGLTGRTWDVTIIGAKSAGDVVAIGGREYIRSKNGRFYSCDALKESVPLWDGVKVYDNHLTDEEFEKRQGMRSVEGEWLGNIVQPRWEEATRRLCGIFKVVDDGLAKKLKNAWDQKILGVIGLSIDTLPVGRQMMFEGKSVPLTEGFRQVYSVDLVSEPAAGGGFNRLIAAATERKEIDMDREEIVQLVREIVAEALDANNAQEQQTEPPAVEPEEVVEQVQQAAAAAAAEVVEEVPPEAAPATVAQAAADAAAVAAQQAADDIAEEEESAMEAVRRLECRLMLRDRLDAAQLPAPMSALVQTTFGNRVFEEAELNDFIKRAKEAQAALDTTGRVSGTGQARGSVQVGLAPRDVAEIEFMRLMMGNTEFRALEHVDAEYVQERVAEAYKGWIRAGRPRYSTRRISEWVYNLLDGDPFTDQRASEAVTTSGMTSIVKNALNVMLAANYAKKHFWWEPVVRSEEVDTIDQATLVRVYGFDTLDVVEAGQPYTELSWRDDEETADFHKRGNYVGVHLETLLSDKLNIVRSIPERLSMSWYNTISSLVSAVFTTNTAAGPVLGDTGALFNATAVTTAGGHANLLTAALSFTSYGAARTAMMKQTDQYSGGGTLKGQRSLIQPKFMFVPVDLETAALQIRNSECIPGSANNDVNPHHQKFEVVVVPNWTDTNNWALLADPVEFPAIWLIFLRGKKVPELFTADSETQGSMFTNDTLRYKVRMMTWRFSSTYDCAPVSDWRPLHKNNVS